MKNCSFSPCILDERTRNEIKKKMSFCGNNIEWTQWSFLGPEHATYSIMAKDMIPVCQKCIDKIIEILKTNPRE